MKQRVMCQLLCDNETRAAQIRDAVISDLVGKGFLASRFDISNLEDLITWLCGGDVEFNVELDATTFFGQVVNRWTTGGLAGRILAGRRISRHPCPHPC